MTSTNKYESSSDKKRIKFNILLREDNINKIINGYNGPGYLVEAADWSTIP